MFPERLIDEGHRVVLHARSRERAAAVDGLAWRSAGVVVGDLGSAVDTRRVAEQVSATGRPPAILAVNIFAPYVLTSLITRPTRLIFLSIGMHRDGVTWLRDIDWLERRALAEAERSAL